MQLEISTIWKCQIGKVTGYYYNNINGIGSYKKYESLFQGYKINLGDEIKMWADLLINM